VFILNFLTNELRALVIISYKKTKQFIIKVSWTCSWRVN